MVRFDAVLSYWIFAWYILYLLQIVKTSPKLPLLLGLLENAILFFMIVGKTNIPTLLYFLGTVALTKLLPLYKLRNVRIGVVDKWYLMAVLVVYIGWLYITNTLDVYLDILRAFIQNKPNQLPGIQLLKSVVHNM